MKKGNIYELEIIDTTFPGLGVAMLNDKKVLVKGAVPGQKIKARITKSRKDKTEANILELVEDADYTIKPSCEHFGVCGGCTHQFLPYERQLELKKQQVKQLFDKAGITDYEFLGIEGSPEVFEYRNKMEFSFGDMVKDGELTLGMHGKGMSFGIISTDYCKLVDEDFRMIHNKVLQYFRGKELPYYRVLRHEGYLRNLVIRKGKNTGEILINIVTTSQIDFDLTEICEVLKNLNYKGNLTGIIHTINNSLSDAVLADDLKILFGRDYIYEEILGLKFKITPFSFFQTNSKGAEVLYETVRSFIDNPKDSIIFDLYCGTGTIGQMVSKNAKKVIGIELIEEAAAAANENTKLNNINNCTFLAGDVAKVIKEITTKPDIIIVDPPRPGISPAALEHIVRFDADQIIYVSCNPKTLVNDLKFLIDNGYEVKKVKAVDMFPSTPHVETVVRIERK